MFIRPIGFLVFLQVPDNNYRRAGQHRKCRNNVYPDVTFCSGCVAGSFGKYAGFAHYLSQWLIEHNGQCAVQYCLQKIKGEKDRQKHFRNGLSGSTHIERRDKVIPREHHQRHENRAAGKTRHRALNGMYLFVQDRSGAGKSRRGNKIHKRADRSRAAYRNHFNQRYNRRHYHGGKRPEHESADSDYNVLRFVLQKHYHGYSENKYCQVRNRGHKGQRYKLFHVHAGFVPKSYRFCHKITTF